MRRPIAMLEACRRRYGDTFTLRFPGFDPLVILSDPAAIKQIFTGDADELRAGEANIVLAPFVGTDSLLLADGARHRRKRRLLMPPFHGERMQLYGELMRTIADRAIDAWPVGRPFPLHAETQRITLDVILHAVFGFEGAQMEALRARLVEGATVVTEHPSLMLKWLQRDLGPLTAWRRVERLRDETDAILFAEFARRRAEARTDRTDVLSLLMTARDEEDRPMSDGELRDEMITLLLAGHETTATTLAWVIQYVLAHPAVLARLHAEVAERDGAGSTGAAAVDLPYLDATIKETQRLMPIIPMVGRRLRTAMRIGDLDLPAGVVAAPCAYLTHRRADIWEEPDAFRPERFLGTRPTPYEFFPFGGGARACLGAAFASFEMRIVLARILARVELHAAPGYRVRVVRRGITFAPSEGMPVVIARAA
jgi:cytochrome P450 family 110